MDSPTRSGGSYERPGNSNNQSDPINQQKPVLVVAPLNSMPYIGPPTPPPPESCTIQLAMEDEYETEEESGPSMIFVPANTDKEEWENLVAQTRSGIVVTGSAALAPIGPSIGRVNLAQSEDSYYFSVTLPGVSNDEKDFSCDVDPDGNVLIKGVTTTGEKTVCKHSQVFKMLTQNLGPPGHFTVSFKLPGPVDHSEFQGHFENGILEGLVKKR